MKRNWLAGIRRRLWFWRVRRAVHVLDELDYYFQREHYGRRNRRQFWRDFINHRDVRHSVLNDITPRSES